MTTEPYQSAFIKQCMRRGFDPDVVVKYAQQNMLGRGIGTFQAQQASPNPQSPYLSSVNPMSSSTGPKPPPPAVRDPRTGGAYNAHAGKSETRPGSGILQSNDAISEHAFQDARNDVAGGGMRMPSEAFHTLQNQEQKNYLTGHDLPGQAVRTRMSPERADQYVGIQDIKNTGSRYATQTSPYAYSPTSAAATQQPTGPQKEVTIGGQSFAGNNVAAQAGQYVDNRRQSNLGQARAIASAGNPAATRAPAPATGPGPSTGVPAPQPVAPSAVAKAQQPATDATDAAGGFDFTAPDKPETPASAIAANTPPNKPTTQPPPNQPTDQSPLAPEAPAGNTGFGVASTQPEPVTGTPVATPTAQASPQQSMLAQYRANDQGISDRAAQFRAQHPIGGMSGPRRFGR